MSPKADRPRNRRSRLLDEKAKDVLNAAAADIYIQGSSLGRGTRRVLDTAPSQNFRFHNHGFQVLQANVTIKRVHKNVKAARDRRSARRPANLEVRNVHRSMRLDLG